MEIEWIANLGTALCSDMSAHKSTPSSALHRIRLHLFLSPMSVAPCPVHGYEGQPDDSWQLFEFKCSCLIGCCCWKDVFGRSAVSWYWPGGGGTSCPMCTNFSLSWGHAQRLLSLHFTSVYYITVTEEGSACLQSHCDAKRTERPLDLFCICHLFKMVAMIFFHIWDCSCLQLLFTWLICYRTWGQ